MEARAQKMKKMWLIDGSTGYKQTKYYLRVDDNGAN